MSSLASRLLAGMYISLRELYLNLVDYYLVVITSPRWQALRGLTPRLGGELIRLYLHFLEENSSLVASRILLASARCHATNSTLVGPRIVYSFRKTTFKAPVSEGGWVRRPK